MYEEKWGFACYVFVKNNKYISTKDPNPDHKAQDQKSIAN